MNEVMSNTAEFLNKIVAKQIHAYQGYAPMSANVLACVHVWEVHLCVEGVHLPIRLPQDSTRLGRPRESCRIAAQYFC